MGGYAQRLDNSFERLIHPLDDLAVVALVSRMTQAVNAMTPRIAREFYDWQFEFPLTRQLLELAKQENLRADVSSEGFIIFISSDLAKPRWIPGDALLPGCLAPGWSFSLRGRCSPSDFHGVRRTGSEVHDEVSFEGSCH